MQDADLSALLPPAADAAEEVRVRTRAEVMYRIHEVSRLISICFDQAMVQHDITRAQWTAIMFVSQNPGATQTELADMMQIGRAAVGKMLDRLEQKNWIVRRPDDRDSRLRRVYSNEEARKLFAFMPQAALHLYDDFFKSMPDGQVEELLVALLGMRANGLAALGKPDTSAAD